MSIHMRALSPETFAALEQFSAERGWPELQAYWEPETAALLAVRLKYVSDSDEVFPKGKWSTIQRLQSLVEEWAQREAAAISQTEG